jgi:hypothetical protein
MPELIKLDARIAVESKLADVAKALDTLDKLTAKAESLELELSKLKAQESALLKDDPRSDESKLPNLLGARGKIDLKIAAIETLRGKPAVSNNIPAVKGKIDVASEELQVIGEKVSQLFKAWNDASLVAYHAHTVEATKAFVQPEDHPTLRQLCARHPLYRQLDAFTPPYFGKDHLRGYADSISNARNLEAIWEQLQANADGYQDLSVSVHKVWVD